MLQEVSYSKMHAHVMQYTIKTMQCGLNCYHAKEFCRYMKADAFHY